MRASTSGPFDRERQGPRQRVAPRECRLTSSEIAENCSLSRFGGARRSVAICNPNADIIHRQKPHACKNLRKEGGVGGRAQYYANYAAQSNSLV